jgi:nucleoside-diphosphate-sugar epimerase
MLTDKKILISGATGAAFRPAAEALAADNEVWCLGRFGDPAQKAELEAQGMKTFAWSMEDASLEGLDDDFTHVLHAAWAFDRDFTRAIHVNNGGLGALMYHCRKAEAFVFISTFAVYASAPTLETPVSETYPIGGFSPFMPSYGVSKISAEGAVSAFATALGLPATIARLNMAYSPCGKGGLPIDYFRRILNGEPIPLPEEGHTVPCSLIGADDIAHFTEGLWTVAHPTTTIVNLAGDEATSVVEFMSYLADRAGLPIEFVVNPMAPQTKVSDNTRRRELLGECIAPWRDSLPRAIEAHFPGVVFTA